jgi:hypothetical protein
MDGENTKTHSTTIRIRYDEIWMEKILIVVYRHMTAIYMKITLLPTIFDVGKIWH